VAELTDSQEPRFARTLTLLAVLAALAVVALFRLASPEGESSEPAAVLPVD
jgi:hypothetical protein